MRTPGLLAVALQPDRLTGASIAEARARILERIAIAAQRTGRDPAGVEVVAVTKTVEPARIREAAAAGFSSFGENRVQERRSKADALADVPAAWHLIGPLQSNKARRAIELFDVIETVDAIDLARRLDRLVAEVRPGRRMRVLLQANVDLDQAKAGFQPGDLERDLGAILDLPNLAVDGLMTVGRLVERPEDARPTFVRLRELSERLRARDPRLGSALSMGMTDDYPIAVEEGATIVRIGRAIFGERPGHEHAAG
ncbi:MAG TPA: YggS family pyridoxal phosphate-dependent enzyme [Candidatus Binatia bacterium]|nr:YggS family pyridoxal phosphate-dependent enzyme [Candidatus Binatia bacterium]